MEDKSSILKGIAYSLSKRYIAGASTAAMLKVVGKINEDLKAKTTVTFLNNHVNDLVKARYNANTYMQTAKQLSRLGLRADVSLRPSQIGSTISNGLFKKNANALLSCMEDGSRLWIECENSTGNNGTLYSLRRIGEDYSKLGVELNVDDSLEYISHKLPEDVAIKLFYHKNSADKAHSEAYIKVIDKIASTSRPTMVSSRDLKWLGRISRAKKAYKRNLTFEMPLGYNNKLMGLIKDSRYASIYVPYGKDWVPYVLNRIAEGRVKRIAERVLKNGNGASDGNKKKGK